jgi:hypothetical protein
VDVFFFFVVIVMIMIIVAAAGTVIIVIIRLEEIIIRVIEFMVHGPFPFGRSDRCDSDTTPPCHTLERYPDDERRRRHDVGW